MVNHDDFKNISGDRHRPVVFWSLNHRLEEEELAWQIKEMADKGVAGFFMHSRSGLLTPYMSERWLELIGFMIKEAAAHGMQAWLYDEDPYPSGIAGGKVIADHPEYKAKTLSVISKTVSGPDRLCMDIPMNKIVMAEAVRMEGNRIAERKDISGSIGILRTTWQDSTQRHTYYPTTEASAKPHYRADTSDPYYRLEWDAPEGDWTAYVFYRQIRGRFWLFESYTDLLEPDAVDYFIQTTYDKYYERFGEYFGNTIPGIFVDEAKYQARPLAWTDKLPEVFMSKKGYDIKEALIACAVDFEGAGELRKDYWETVSDLFSETFGGRVRDWCDRHGLMLVGHVSPEEDPVSQINYVGDLMKFMKYFNITGSDIITYMVGDRQNPILNLGPKLASSVARQWGDGRAMSESFGVTEWKLAVSDMAWITNWLYSLGINMMVPHVFGYSIDGYRKKDAGPSQFYHATYWEYYRIYSDFVARLGYALSESEACTDTALVVPLRGIMAAEPVLHGEAIELRDRFVYLFDCLLRNHVQFDLVSESDLDEAEVSDGKLKIGNCSYGAVVLPTLKCISSQTLDKIQAISAAGVLIAADAEENISRSAYNYDIYGSPEKGFKNEGLDSLAEKLADGVKLSGPGARDILLNRRKSADKEIFFLCNTASEKALVQVDPGPGKNISAECWDPRDGARSLPEISEGACSIEIAPRASVFIVFSEIKGAAPAVSVLRNQKAQSVIQLVGEWKCRTLRRNTLILDMWRATAGDGPGYADTGLQVYGWEVNRPGTAVKDQNEKGVVWYRADFRVRGEVGELALVLEDSAIDGQYEIFFNGAPVTEPRRVREFDCFNLEYRLGLPRYEADDVNFYGRGRNVIAVRVKTGDKGKGMLEPLRIFGDFIVKLNEGESLGAVLEKPSGRIMTGDWTVQGYPHYSGALEYIQEVHMAEVRDDLKYILNVCVGKDLAEISVNGTPAGVLAWEPYSADISGMLKSGNNTITVKVINTAENLLFGTQRPSGMLAPAYIEINHNNY